MRFYVRLLLPFFAILFTLQLLSPSISAQTVIDPQWQNIKQEDGLLSNDVLTILVDEGTIWFGSSAGINRFDGAWKAYPSAADEQFVNQEQAGGELLPPGFVRTLARANSDGSIWAGMQSGWIARFDQQTRQWSAIVNVEDEITALRVIDSTLWVGSPTGLSLYEIQAESAEIDSAIVLSKLENSPPTAFENVPIEAIFKAQNKVLVGSHVGLWQYGEVGDWSFVQTPPASAFLDLEPSWCNADVSTEDEGESNAAAATATPQAANRTAEQPARPPEPTEINALWVDDEDAIWIGTPFGVARLIVETQCWNVIPTVKRNGEPARVQMLTGGEDDSVWAATDGGGARKFVDHGQITLEYGQVTGKLNDFVRAVSMDQDGSIWFATPVGVFRFLERSWFNDPSNGLFSSTLGDPNLHDVRDLLVDESGDLWIATGAGIRHKKGLTYSDVDELFTVDNSDLPGNTILTLAQDGEKAIWAGLFGAGIARYQDGTWTMPVAEDQLPSLVVTDLLVQGNMLWIGTEAGLASYDLVAQTVTTEAALATHVVESLALDSADRLWVGTRQADIWVLQDAEADQQNADRWRVFDAASFQDLARLTTMPLEPKLTLAADPKAPNGMWAAIDRVGLFQWDGEAWRNGDPSDNLPTNFLWTLFSDSETGLLWIGNEAGITGYDGETWVTLKDRDGLRSSAIYAIAHVDNGGYWFGGKTGLSYYRPEQTAPWIHLQDAPAGLKILTDEGKSFAEVGQKLDFELAYGDLLTPQNELKTFYRLTNSDNLNQWQEFQPPLNITFDDAGEYAIEFRVRDQAFNYSAIMVAPLIVEPPAFAVYLPWLGRVQRNTFQTLVALGLVSLLGFAYMSMEIVQGRRRATEAIMRSYNPYVSGEPVRRGDMFFGRHNLLQRIVDTLHNNSIMIHGERRIGKTTLLYQLASSLEDVDDPDYWFVPIYVDLEGTEQERFFHFLIEEIAHKALTFPDLQGSDEDELLVATIEQLQFHDLADTEYTDREFNRDLRNILRSLQEVGKKNFPAKRLRTILLLDEMDVINGYDHLVQQQLRRIFMRDFATTLGAVVAGIQISREWDRIESPWYNLFNEIEVEPFTREQAVELLVEPVKNYYSYEPAALEFIIQQSEGRPFRLQQYALEAVTSMLAGGRRRIKLSDVEMAHRNIQNSTNHAHKDDGLFQTVTASSE